MQVDDRFYQGIVIDNNDEYRRGRVQVRIKGLHDGFENDNIKWAEVIQPTFMGILGGTGACSVLRIGTGVWIRFDKDFDHPIVVGVLVGGTEEHNDLYDTPLPIENRKGSDWSTEAIPKNCDFRYKTLLKARNHINTVHPGKYLTTTTLETPGGHLIELDDTSNTAAIRITHSSGLSQITLNEDGSICIIGHTVNVTSAEMMKLESIGDISIEAKKNIYIKSGGKTAIESADDLCIKSDKTALVETSDNMHIKAGKDASIEAADSSGNVAIKAGSQVAVEANDKINALAKNEVSINGNNGFITLNDTTDISSSGGKVNIFGNKCNIDTALNVFDGINVNGLISSNSFMLSKDFIPAMFPAASVTALTESYDREMSSKVKEINNDLNNIRAIPDDSEEKNIAILNIRNKIKDLDDDWNKKKENIKGAMLKDFISQHIDHFGSINPEDIQLLTESVDNALRGSGLSITPRTPNGDKKNQEQSKCNCDWTDPKSWFGIHEIDPFTADRFKNILNYDIRWPGLKDLFPGVPEFSLLAVVKMVMKIAANKVIKLLSAFRKLIMRFIQPVIDVINSVIDIINSIPPKIEFKLDLTEMIGAPLFNFPELPDSSMPNICCSVNECTCGNCASAVDQWQKDAEKWAEENVSSEPIMPDMSEYTSKLPSGGKKTGSLI